MNPTLQNWLGEQIQALKDQHLYKVPKILESPAAGRVRMNGKVVVNLSSNNYLGLNSHPKLKEAAIKAVQEWGAGSGNWSTQVTQIRIVPGPEALPVFGSGLIGGLALLRRKARAL